MRDFILTSQGIQRDVKENVWTLKPQQNLGWETDNSNETDW